MSPKPPTHKPTDSHSEPPGQQNAATVSIGIVAHGDDAEALRVPKPFAAGQPVVGCLAGEDCIEPASARNNGKKEHRRISSREIWALTWPQALMMLFQFLVGMTDVVVAGEIDSNVQAALGIINQCQFFLLVFGFAVVNGGVTAMSQSMGADKALRAERYIGLLFKLVGGICLLILLAGYIFREALFTALQVPGEIFSLTLDLWLFTLWLIPCGFLNALTAGVFRSRKNVLVPLLSGIIVCIVNTLGDLGLGLGWFGMPELGGRGLVLASILSMGMGGLFTLGVLIRRGIVSRRSFAPWAWERRALPYIVKVALPAGGTQVLWQLGYMVLFLITNTLPSDRVASTAGLTVGLRVESILFMPAWAFSMTGTILVGHCLGMGDRGEARRVGLRVAGAGALSMSLVALLILPWVREITAFVAPDPAVQAVAVQYILFNIAATPFTVTSMIMSGIFTGAGATVYTLVVFTVSTWLVRLPLAWYMGHIFWREASGIFLAMLVSQVVQASFAFYIFLRRDWYRFALGAKRFTKDR